MRAPAIASLAALLVSCTTPVESGQRLYQEGDRLGALETWRSVPPDSEGYTGAQARIAELEPEFERLVQEYEQSAREYEAQGRLTEAILDYRLVLKLEPEDQATFDHVQQLARTRAAQKAELEARYAQVSNARDLVLARKTLEELRRLDPFDAALETRSRLLDEQLGSAIEAKMQSGRDAFAAGDYPAAARSFRAVLILDAENEAARGYLSYIDTMRREREAAPMLAAGGADPNSSATDNEMRAEGFHLGALAAERRGEPYTAIRLEMRAIEAVPDHAGARQHLQQLRRRQAGDVDALVEAGRIAFSEEDLRTAIELWDRALLVDPDNERVRAYVGRASHQLENLELLRAAPADTDAGGGS